MNTQTLQKELEELQQNKVILQKDLALSTDHLEKRVIKIQIDLNQMMINDNLAKTAHLAKRVKHES